MVEEIHVLQQQHEAAKAILLLCFVLFIIRSGLESKREVTSSLRSSIPFEILVLHAGPTELKKTASAAAS